MPKKSATEKKEKPTRKKTERKSSIADASGGKSAPKKQPVKKKPPFPRSFHCFDFTLTDDIFTLKDIHFWHFERKIPVLYRCRVVERLYAQLLEWFPEPQLMIQGSSLWQHAVLLEQSWYHWGSREIAGYQKMMFWTLDQCERERGRCRDRGFLWIPKQFFCPSAPPPTTTTTVVDSKKEKTPSQPPPDVVDQPKTLADLRAFLSEDIDVSHILNGLTVEESMFQCPKCRNQKKIYREQKPYRGDEAQKMFFFCSQCHYKWSGS